MDTFDTWLKMPLLRPCPIPTPKPIDWYDVKGHLELASYRSETRNWRIEEDFLFFIPWLNTQVCIPGGFVFDGASIPRPLWSVMSPTGIMFIPGLFHDFGYRYNCFIDKNYKPVFVNSGQKFFDEQIRDLGIHCNDATTASYVTYSALRAFGFAAWNERRKEGCKIEVDFPQKV